MKRCLLIIAMAAVSTQALAQSTSFVAVMPPEASTISLIAAGFIALGIARRNTDKTTKS